MNSFSFSVNGQLTNVDADDSTPLLYVLRDTLQLNSPRYGCGEESCGACCVLLDDKPVFSCTLPIAAVASRSVTTVEGLSQGGQRHVLQQAFLEFNAAQCGYCSSGILMSASHLLATNPAPTRAEIQAALDAHLCRCGAHNRVIRAILHAAQRLGGSSA